MKKILLVCVVLLVVAVGCGKGFVKLGGQVTYSDTGEPLEKGTVALTDGKIQARGILGKDGKFVIGSHAAGDGLPPGEYTVYITDAAIVQGLPEPPAPGSPPPTYRSPPKWIPLIHSKYNTPETSELTLTVTAKTKKFDIQVDRPK